MMTATVRKTSLIILLFLCLFLAQAEQFYGVAHIYGLNYAGNMTASGEVFNPEGFTAAHSSYAFNSVVRVTNISNGLSVEVRINDRAPLANTDIGLSLAAAQSIGIHNQIDRQAQVQLELIRQQQSSPKSPFGS